MGNGDLVSAVTAPARSMGWDAARRALRVQVWGASGALGRELVRALLLAGHPVGNLDLFGQGEHVLGWHGEELPVKPTPARHGTAELAFLCTPPDFARARAPQLISSGTRVVDVSGAFRLESDVPLIAPGVNTEDVGAFTTLVALPEPSTAMLAPVLANLDQRAGLTRVTITHLRSAACRGARGILAWRQELARSVNPEPAADGPAEGEASLVGGFDPCEGGLAAQGNSNAELLLTSELRRVLSRPDLPIGVSAVRVGSERVDGFAVDLELGSDVVPEDVARALIHVPGVEVVAGEGPDVASALGEATLKVGRIRTGSNGAGSLCFFAVGDRLRAGAALAALQVASSLPWA